MLLWRRHIHILGRYIHILWRHIHILLIRIHHSIWIRILLLLKSRISSWNIIKWSWLLDISYSIGLLYLTLRLIWIVIYTVWSQWILWIIIILISTDPLSRIINCWRTYTLRLVLIIISFLLLCIYSSNHSLLLWNHLWISLTIISIITVLH